MQITTALNSALIDNKAAAEYLGKPVSWLHHEAANEGIPRYKIGNHYRYRLSELDAWIDSQAVTA